MIITIAERVMTAWPFQFTVTERQYRIVAVPCLVVMWICCTYLAVHAFR